MTETVTPQPMILVIEDEIQMRRLLRACLERNDYRVIEAANGDEAHQLLVEHPEQHIDVLFTDVVMPGRLDGIDLANEARTLRSDLPVLYATGFANLLRVNREADLRGPVLRKPYRPRELHRASIALLHPDPESDHH